MIHPKCIIPECNADTFFVEIVLGLKPPPKGANHQHNKTKALGVLNSIDVPKALAIIDKDPGASVRVDFSDYELKDFDEQDFLKLYKHKKKEYFIIEINKEFEYWLDKKVIPESEINLDNFDIPKNKKEFYNYFKSNNIRQKGKIAEFFKALSQSNSSSMQKYITWLKECTS